MASSAMHWAAVGVLLVLLQGLLGPVAGRSIAKKELRIEKDVKFYIFNSGSLTGTLVESTADSLLANGFNASLSTTVVVHGYGHDITDPLFANVAAALVTVGAPTNVLGLDWGVLCPKPRYLTARSKVQPVGETLAALLQALTDAGLARLPDVHLVGHSLGAHVAACASKIARVGRISGLDPAQPLFFDFNADRLKATDADFVDVIHTAIGSLGLTGLGYRLPLGSVDFYPNGGTVSQPGCGGLAGDGLSGSCSHRRAHELYGESILDAAAFPAKPCDSYANAIADRCTGTGPAANMGYHLQPSDALPGVYYLETLASSPFKKL